MTTDELVAFILPWVKEHRPDAYAATIAVAKRPATLRRYLLRGIELRVDAEPEFRGRVPLSVLDETALCVTVRDAVTGRTFTVGGALARPKAQLPFRALGTTRADLDALLAAVDTMDLEAHA